MSSPAQKKLYWFKKAGKNERASALRSINTMYDYGVGIKRDYKEAILWYIKSKGVENIRVLRKIGRLYFYGKGVGHSHKKALEYLDTLSKSFDDAAVYYIMGCIHSLGYNSVKIDYPKSLEYLLKSSAMDYPDAHRVLGMLLLWSVIQT